MDILLSFGTLGTVLVQGGYFPTVFLIVTLVMSGGFVFVKKPIILRGTWWGWALAGWYLCSAICRGYRSDAFSQASLPLCCALFLAVYCCLPKTKKSSYLNILMTGTGILAGISILAFSGVLPLNEAVTSHRLQGTFQYANAAGSWFAAIALLTQDCEDFCCRKFALANIIALFLTRSTGALGVYMVIQGIRAFSRRREGAWADAVLLHIAALPFAAFFFMVSGWPAIPALILSYFLGWHLEQLLETAKRLRLQWVCLFFGGAAVAAFIAGQRFASSMGTFIERLVQMKDGLAAISLHPVFGLGAGSWAELVPYYQSAQYSATVIHSSPILIGVDAGIPAMLLALGLIVSGWRRGGRTPSQNMAAMLLIIHSVFDFTMCFYPLTVLLLALLFVEDENNDNSSKNTMQRTAAIWRMGAVACALLSAWLLASELETKQLNARVNAQNWSAAVIYYEDRQLLFGKSQKARTAYVHALYGEGDLEGVLRSTEKIEQLSLNELLLRAQALKETGDQDGACELLLEQLELRLYQTELFRQTAELFLHWEADEGTINAYNQIVDLANDSRTFLGALMGNQVYIERICLKEEK